MKVAVENLSPVKKKLTIEIAPDSVSKELEKAILDVAKKAKIPGFRPGKAPKAIVERHYGEEVRSEVLNRLISDSYIQALQEQKLSPVDMPALADISPLAKGSALSFTATVEVRPEINLGAYDGIEVKEAPVTVVDEEVEQTINRLRDMYARLEVVEGRPLSKDHTAIIDFEGFQGDKSIEGATAKDYTLELGTGSLIPGFEDQLIGMNKGETREITVTFPADYSNKELAGKDAKFTVTLKEVKKKALPELNDEFAKDIGDHKTVEELKARIKEDIEVRKKNDRASAQREELLTKLVEAHTFDIPEGMVERELQSMARQQAMRMARQRIDIQSSFDLAKFKEGHRELAVKRVKGSLILDAVAEKEQIDVTEAEVDAAMAAMARNAGQKLDEIKKYYESKDGGTEGLRASLIEEKALSLLLSRAKKV